MTATTLADRALVRLSGDDVAGFLQGLVTNAIGPVSEKTPVWAGLLTAQGKVLFDFLVWRDGEDYLLDCEAEQAEGLIQRLRLYRLRRQIEIARDDNLSVHWSPDSADKPLDPRLPDLGRRWLSPETDGDASEAWRAHRLSLGVTEGFAELGSDKTLWLECNAEELGGVDFQKGCYVGQENTARMHYRNKVNRRLTVVPLGKADEKRQRIAYPDLGLSVEHRRVEDIERDDLPGWLAPAIDK